jgi:hypothetical protein
MLYLLWGEVLGIMTTQDWTRYMLLLLLLLLAARG